MYGQVSEWLNLSLSQSGQRGPCNPYNPNVWQDILWNFTIFCAEFQDVSCGMLPYEYIKPLDFK